MNDQIILSDAYCTDFANKQYACMYDALYRNIGKLGSYITCGITNNDLD
jgi:hypothetical protein